MSETTRRSGESRTVQQLYSGHYADGADEGAPDPEDITVALCYPGNRADRMLLPLQTTNLDLTVSPEDPYASDIVMLDNPDKDIIWPVLKSRHRDCKVLYRIRGDMLRAYRELNHTSIKYKLAKAMIGRVDGAVSIEPVLGRKFLHATGVSPVGLATLAKRPEKWPTVEHTSHQLRAITLTNANYLGKIQPLIDYADLVNRVLLRVGGRWDIYGRGRYSDYLADHLGRYSQVRYRGYTDDPKARLEESNLMLHLSTFDSLPNAIVEGMASGLPVITNPYDVFSAYGDPLIVRSRLTLEGTLEDATDPAWRDDHAARGLAHVRSEHSPERVGQQYVRFFQRLVHDS